MLSKLGRKIADHLYGFDFFISYTWRDAEDFANQLEKKLTTGNRKKKFRVFLDKNVFNVGDDLNKETQRRVKMSTVFVLLMTPISLKSKWVRKEVETSMEANKRILPININGAFEKLSPDNPLARSIKENKSLLRIDLEVPTKEVDDPAEGGERKVQRLCGEPPDECIERIFGSFMGTNTETRRSRIISLAAVVLLILFILSLIFAGLTLWKSEIAERNLARAYVKQADTLMARHRVNRAFLYAAKSYDHVDKNQDAQKILLENTPYPLFAKVPGHKGNAGTDVMAFSPDGRLLASGGWDNLVRICHLDKNKKSEVLGKHTNSVSHLAFSPDGNFLASSPMLKGELFLWNLETRTKKQLDVQTDSIDRILFTPDGSMLLCLGEEPGGKDTIRFLDAASGKSIGILKLDSGVTDMALSSDGTKMACVSSNGDIGLLDLEKRKILRVFSQPRDDFLNSLDLWCIEFSPNGKWLAGGGSQNVVWIWNTETGKPGSSFTAPNLMEKPDPTAAINQVSFIGNGKLLAGAGSTGAAVIWDFDRRKTVGIIDLPDRGARIAISPDGTLLAAGSYSQWIEIWDISSRHQRAILRHYQRDWWNEGLMHVSNVSFNQEGDLMVTGTSSGEVRLWDLNWRTYQQLYRDPMKRNITGVRFSSDGNKIAASSFDAKVWLFNLKNKDSFESKPFFIDQSSYSSYDVAFSPNGKRFAASFYGYIRVWDWHSGQWASRDIKFADSEVFESEPLFETLAFSGNSSLWMCHPNDLRVFHYNFETGNLSFFEPYKKEKIQLSDGGIDDIAVSSDSTLLATVPARGMKMLRIWGISGDKPVMLKQLPLAAYQVDFSPNNRLLAATSSENSIHLWSLVEEKELAVFRGHTGQMTEVAFSPDGMIIASSSHDGTARIWNIESLYLPYRRSYTFARMLTGLRLNGSDIEYDLQWPQRYQRERFFNKFQNKIQQDLLRYANNWKTQWHAVGSYAQWWANENPEAAKILNNLKDSGYFNYSIPIPSK